MAITTYDGLKTAIGNWTDKDLTDYYDDFIDLAEARHKRDLRLREMLRRDTIGIGGRFADVPKRYLGAKTIRLILTDQTVPLIDVTQERMDRIRTEEKRRPRAFTIHEQIEFDSLPDLSYRGEIIYYEEPTPLSSSVSSNTILRTHPDLYLYACNAAAAEFLQDPERFQLWDGRYQSSVHEAMQLDTRTVGTPISRVPMRLP